MSDLNWASLLGRFVEKDGCYVFQGGLTEYEGSSRPTIGNAVCDQSFSGGRVSATIRFARIEVGTACELMLHYNPGTRAFVTAGLGGAGLYSIRHFFNQWSVIATAGDTANLQPDRDYQVEAEVLGSQIALTVDGVDVLRAQFPVHLPESQVGVWCMSSSDIIISSYAVHSHTPSVFVVMQFSSPYNEIYLEVIQRICKELDIEARRADDIYGPGVIIEDITRQMLKAQAVIAEISPINANVYYEVGYAHALSKPTILLAEKGTNLPFDVSPFRILLYENTIPGRSSFEAGLRNHLNAIFLRRGCRQL